MMMPELDEAFPEVPARSVNRTLHFLFLALLVTLSACGADPPDTLGPTEDGLPSCPDAPNCVHTGDGHPPDVLPFHLSPEWSDRSAEAVWSAVEAAVASLQGTEIVTRTENYLHAQSTSRIFRFVDDLEIYWRPNSLELVVRSESRIGRSDLGVNMTRVERLRQFLQAEGVVE
jgi:uncharacterized protein (DUF1499 family)